jgi:DNA-binding transcriptional MerR regulator
MTVKAPETLGPRELARRCGVSADTLRHYERKGVIPRAARGANGYRRYPADTEARVRLVQRALVVGFTLDELARVFAERDRGAPPCRSVRDLVARRLAELDARLRSLRALRGELRALLAAWDGTLASLPAGQPAHLLQSLARRPGLDRARTGPALAGISKQR